MALRSDPITRLDVPDVVAARLREMRAAVQHATAESRYALHVRMEASAIQVVLEYWKPVQTRKVIAEFGEPKVVKGLRSAVAATGCSWEAFMEQVCA